MGREDPVCSGIGGLGGDGANGVRGGGAPPEGAEGERLGEARYWGEEMGPGNKAAEAEENQRLLSYQLGPQEGSGMRAWLEKTSGVTCLAELGVGRRLPALHRSASPGHAGGDSGAEWVTGRDRTGVRVQTQARPSDAPGDSGPAL